MSLRSFPGGIHPDDMKHLSRNRKIEPVPMPEKLIIPMSQHIGAPAKCIVKKGDRVRRGQKIGEAEGFVSVPVHASASGEVTAVGEAMHPFGKMLMSVTIKPDESGDTVEGWGVERPWEELSRDELKTLVREAGIVGLGGATFPTHVKLSPPPDKHINTLVINAAECEPYLTSDYRLMMEKTHELLSGIRILKKILDVEECRIGIESNKKDCFEILEKEIQAQGLAGITPILLEVKYPQGAEIQLIYALTGREVPSGKLPMDAGVVVQNAGTAIAVSEAVERNIPLTERVVTVTGSTVGTPGNYLVPFGTPLKHLLDVARADLEKTGKIIFGGPMMGMAQAFLDVPVIKGTSGVLLQALDETIKDSTYSSCLRCGKCVEICPMWLMPTRFGSLSRTGRFQECEEAGLFDCKECGSCTFVCPSHIPLTHFIKLAKFRVLEEKRRQKS
ncbi:MAG: electron transport complex subunit RsxC [Candidatus Wallbacteria bacterium]|nr:electron transport complex subunit RsxC [Candidatus Wallbacteria bacterium]